MHPSLGYENFNIEVVQSMASQYASGSGYMKKGMPRQLLRNERRNTTKRLEQY